ncbi:VOC family protein [uncultured Jatrophihabitans sp.]|uniref:VOC family protein n=1 Tax=uncultured Jatrophihabitans sp. TaxID=1610747 RepID=UPI0035CBF45E
MEVLSGRVLLRPRDRAATQRFYRDVLGLAVAREFGDRADPGVVFHAGNSLIEVSGAGTGAGDACLWLQVRDVHAEHQRLRGLGLLGELGGEILRAPQTEPWGLVEMWLADPDGTRIVLVEVPADHPLRRDTRPPLPAPRQGMAAGSVTSGC